MPTSRTRTPAKKTTTPRKRATPNRDKPEISPVLEVTPVSAWKKATESRELKLPSGNVCKIIRPGMDSLLSEGVLPDSMAPIIMKMIQGSQEETKEKSEADIGREFLAEMGGMDAMSDLFDAASRVTAHCVVEPPVRYHRRQREDDGKWEVIPARERSSEFLYTDDVDSDDKFFIFQFVSGGDDSLKSFRQ